MIPSDVRRARKRTCNVCGGSFTAPTQNSERRHNCLSIRGVVIGELPNECWQNRGHPDASELLASMPSYAQKSARSDLAHRRRLELTTRVLEWVQANQLTVDNIDALRRDFGQRAVHDFVKRLSAESRIRAQFESALGELRQRDDAAARKIAPRDEPPAVTLPEDFERGIRLFVEKTHRIAEIKHKHGHRYSAITVRKREHDARAFCEFLVRKGLDYWPQVAQHHLDEYISETNHGAADRASTFLAFIRRHFRLTQRFVRPRRRRKPPTEAVLPISEIPTVLKRLMGCSDLQVIVAGLFLALFAQTPTRSAELTYSNVRKRAGKIEALFAEQWTPLDPLTTRFLLRLAPRVVEDGANGATRLFRYSAGYLGDKVHQAVGVHVRPLRLGAVANLIRSGITDRGALHRVLGVSLPTLAYVEKLFEWDLHMTVDPEMVESRNEVIRGERTE
mgnify:CR=1 FL=1